jgi:hypothetical protein
MGHFALNDGFALLVLTVPDNDGAVLCRQALAASGQDLIDLSPDGSLECSCGVVEDGFEVIAVPAGFFPSVLEAGDGFGA